MSEYLNETSTPPYDLIIAVLFALGAVVLAIVGLVKITSYEKPRLIDADDIHNVIYAGAHGLAFIGLAIVTALIACMIFLYSLKK